jgi:SAM-dependent methyltransferase
MKKLKKTIKKIIPGVYYTKISSVYHYLRLLSCFGFKYQCIFCNGRFRRLLPTGLKNETALSIIGGGCRYALCPKCHSTDRERLIYWYIANKTNILNSQNSIKLLHVAPEKILQKAFRNSNKIQYINGDLNPLTADKKIDITDINFEDNSFDFIICNHVLEHVKDDKKAMSELFRVLKPGGEAILQVPISKYNKDTFEDFSMTTPEEKERSFGQKDHVRIYGKNYPKILEKVGFQVNLYDIKKELNGRNIEKYGLNKEEILYIGKKL